MSSRVWMVLSDCQFVWRWYVMLKGRCVPKASCRLIQNLDVNMESLSDPIDTGMSWSLITSCTYSLVNRSKEYVDLIVRKCANLVNWFTITQTKLLLCGLLGKLETKSMVIFFHFYSRMGSGCNSPAGRLCSIFTCWHTKHHSTYSATSFFMPIH